MSRHTKTYLVARRDYLENVRTKTFWIGILAFPVILVTVIFVPKLLEKTKDVRTYAVLDKSGWLSDAVHERSDGPDFSKVFDALLDDYQDGEGDISDYPEVLQQMAPALGQLEEAHLKITSQFYASAGSPSPEMTMALNTLPDAIREGIRSSYEQIRQWWKSLSPKEAKALAPGLDRGSYALKTFEDLGEDPEKTLKEKLNDNEIFAFFVINEDPVETAKGAKYVSNNLTDRALAGWFSGFATDIVRERRIEKAEIDPETAKHIQSRFVFETKQVSEEGVEEKVEDQDQIREFAPIAFVYLLWISIFTIAQMLLTSTVEEKSNRTIEVLLSSVSPVQLMIGKIAGIAATGLTVILSWVVFFFVIVEFLPYFIGDFGIDLGQIISDPVYLSSFVVYFLMGYLLFASILVALGSVCSSLKEAQHLMQPVMLLLIVPLLAMFPIGQDPNGTLAKVMSYIPIFTPFTMMNRAAGPPELYEYAITGVLLIASIGLAMWGAAKIFRIGILMTGKPPKIREILRWVRAPVGSVPVTDED